MDWLRWEYERRRAKNPHYSKRAFCRHLGVSSGRLSELLSGKRELSVELGERIAERLSLSAQEKTRFLDLTRARREKQSRSKQLSQFAKGIPEKDEYVELPEDAVEAIANWYHLGILSLIRTEDFVSDARWISRRLGISLRETQGAIERLQRLQLIGSEAGQWRRLKPKIKSTDDVPSAALKRAHKQNFELAMRALDKVKIEERDVTSITMAIDTAKLPLAKKMIRNFRRGLADLLEEGAPKEVYTLNIALFPLSFRGEAK